jgi:uncharacterized repeat protein (TIGR03803 family)
LRSSSNGKGASRWTLAGNRGNIAGSRAFLASAGNAASLFAMNCKPRPCSAIRLLGSFIAILALVSSASAGWKEKVLYSFNGGSDGYGPAGGVVFDRAGNLYGANSWGGSGCPSGGCGTAFEVSPPTQKGGAWTETTIYAFRGVGGSDKDGLTPEGGVIIDQQGNLYGTTSLGGNGACVLLGSPVGCGIVYELSPPTQKGGSWTETILYNFQGGNDGYFPFGDLVFDKHGSLYGATWYGGGQGSNCDTYYGGNCGTVFKLSPPKKKGGKWTERILHSFGGGMDGANPNGYLILDGNGAVYGLTFSGGHQSCHCYGTAFKLKPPTKGGAWSEQLLHSFDRTTSDGGNPMAGPTLDTKGRLYGTTLNGGPGPGGIVFRLTPPSGKSGSWKEVVLYGFHGKDGGYAPESTLVFDGSGGLYGTTYVGNGGDLNGSVFRIRRPQRQGGTWRVSYLHGFTGLPDGVLPSAGVVFDKAGHLYGTTQQGGTGACAGGCGSVFQVSP